MDKEQKNGLIRIAVAMVLLIAAWALPLVGVWKTCAFLVAYLVAGWDVLWAAIRNTLHGKWLDEQFLMGLATIGAIATGDYPEAVAVMLFYQIGEWFGDVAVDRSRKSIAALMDIRPETAVVVRDGVEVTVAPEAVMVGETIVIKPGERIPLDGVILTGSTSVDTAALTGESLPVDKVVGENVFSGSVNLSGLITVRTQSAYDQSTVSKILKLIEESSEKKARTENFITKFARVYTPCVVIGAVLLAFVPPLLMQESVLDWVRRALVFLVVSCPCALVVSVPLSFFGGIGGASRKGILIKGANYMETLSNVDTVVFDKTGTLTQGTFAVQAIHPQEVTEAELLDIAAAVESFSTHPIASSIVRAHGGHIDKSRVLDVREIAGQGLSAQINGKRVYVGNGKLMEAVHADWHDCHIAGTAVHIAEEDRYLGHIVITDVVKPDAKDAIAQLKEIGVRKTVMLTGDRKAVAEDVASRIGISETHSECMPDQKVMALETLLGPTHTVAFVGDGINDAPVLSRADIGIAMGAMGSDAAIEAADVVLMDDRLDKLADAIGIARKTMRIVKENIALALAVKALVLLLGALGTADMWIAVFADVGVLIVAILNAIRCMR